MEKSISGDAEVKVKPIFVHAEVAKPISGDAEVKAKPISGDAEVKAKPISGDAEVKAKSISGHAEVAKPISVDAEEKSILNDAEAAKGRDGAGSVRGSRMLVNTRAIIPPTSDVDFKGDQLVGLSKLMLHTMLDAESIEFGWPNLHI
ncbi:hypothetical protein PTKIN_Ptkin14bG0004800 [Pterospermum kingtungense]